MEAVEQQEQRPRPVILLEAIGILGGVAVMVLSRGDVFSELFELLVQVGLTLWVTRGRSRVGRVFYTGVLLFEVAGLVGAFLWGYVPASAASMLVISVFVEIAVFLSLLWWPTTSAWLKGNQG